jgi:hypothetical protein
MKSAVGKNKYMNGVVLCLITELKVVHDPHGKFRSHQGKTKKWYVTQKKRCIKSPVKPWKRGLV